MPHVALLSSLLSRVSFVHGIIYETIHCKSSGGAVCSGCDVAMASALRDEHAPTFAV